MDYLDELRLIESALRAQFDAVVRSCFPLSAAAAAASTAAAAHTDSYFRRPGSRPVQETLEERDAAVAHFEALLLDHPRARAARSVWQAVEAIASQVEYDITGYTP